MRNKLAFRISLGGIISSLCLFCMFCSGFFPMLSYSLPSIAGFFMVIMIIETNAGWAFTTYVSVSLLSFIVTPNFEASLLFAIFMGYYPILKVYLEKIKTKYFKLIIKFAVFNIAVIIYYLLFKHIVVSEDMLEGMEIFGKYAVYVLWLGANFAFVLYDVFLGQLTAVYVNWFRKKILRRK